MTSAWTRIQQIAKELTAHERAILNIRSWLAGEDHRWRVELSMPGEQKPQYERLVGLVRRANDTAFYHLTIWQRWVLDMDTQVGWAQSVLAYQERCAVLTARLKEAGVRVTEEPAKRRQDNRLVVEPLPAIDRGFLPPFKLLYGTVPEDERRSAACEELPAVLLADASIAIANRWMEVTTVEAMLAELSEREFSGERVAHPEVTESIAEMKSLLVQLRDVVAELGEVVKLPEPTAHGIPWMRKDFGLPVDDGDYAGSGVNIEFVDEAMEVYREDAAESRRR